MKEPRFTDQNRWKTPYVPAAATDIRKTFERIQRQHKRTEDPLNPDSYQKKS